MTEKIVDWYVKHQHKQNDPDIIKHILLFICLSVSIKQLNFNVKWLAMNMREFHRFFLLFYNYCTII